MKKCNEDMFVIKTKNDGKIRKVSFFMFIIVIKDAVQQKINADVGLKL